MLKLLRRLFSTLRRSIRRRSNPHGTLLINTYPKPKYDENQSNNKSECCYTNVSVRPGGSSDKVVTIRVATFNAALFSMAPATNAAVAGKKKNSNFSGRVVRPKSILKLPKQKKTTTTSTSVETKLRVSINLPQEDEISRLLGGEEVKKERLTATTSYSYGGKAVSEVLRELNVDVLALQDVKADEENEMKPLSELAEALEMHYVFAESSAPQYGNAILSTWPIRKFEVQKLLDDFDFRNVLKATIDVPGAGEVNFYCTQLDHLDEDWRMKQINVMIESNSEPHLLAGGLNSFSETDYSAERWTDIVKYYQEIGKPRPRADVMRYLKSKQYVDAGDFAGECEPVVMIAKGQNVQGTCKYGTRMDYILASPRFPFEFVPGSYAVYSSQGTSDHHIVKADLIKRKDTICQSHQITKNSCRHGSPAVAKITNSTSSSRGIWPFT